MRDRPAWMLALLLLWPSVAFWGVHLCPMSAQQTLWMRTPEACCSGQDAGSTPTWERSCCLIAGLQVPMPEYETNRLHKLPPSTVGEAVVASAALPTSEPVCDAKPLNTRSRASPRERLLSTHLLI
ncbi:MAG: hypothetical protein N2561_05085 [Bacteroidetes bacterium]|nr:hypothetical protein [Rhodothermia bacterium]MCS7154522.1 hypothetical protein [Bacteroidota bacterium]MCX7906895.1 hypothetical protein [Bacteroidota bacterium]MDW8136826.1 hypothetical protein [Bacteroidota bacterium]MDW8285304.1 hypothetical protein [Bacteroidota bacterium]